MKTSVHTKQIEIYFEDLNEEAQKQFLDAMNIDRPEDANYDIYPIAVVSIS